MRFLLIVFLTSTLAACTGSKFTVSNTKSLQHEPKGRTLSSEEREDARNSFQTGVMNKIRGYYSKAIENFQEALARDSASDVALYYLGDLYIYIATHRNAALVSDRRMHDFLVRQSLAYSEEEDGEGGDSLMSEATYTPFPPNKVLISRGDSLLRHAAELKPDNKLYQVAFFNRLMARGDYHEAELLATLLAKKYGHSEDYERLWSVYAGSGDMQNALDVLHTMEELSGPSYDINNRMFNILMEQGKEREAFKAIERLLDGDDDTQILHVYYASLCLQYGREDQALEICNRVLSAHPNNTSAKMVLIDYYRQRGNYAKAELLTNELLRDPAVTTDDKYRILDTYLNAMVWEKKRAASDANSQSEVYSIIQSVLENPRTEENLVQLCLDYLNQLDSIDAGERDIIEAALLVAPWDGDLRHKMLVYYRSQGDEENLLRTCRKGREYQPEECVYYYYEGYVLYRQGHVDEMLSVMEDCVDHISSSTSPAFASEIYFFYGLGCRDVGDAERMYENFDAALRCQPDNADCLNEYAYALTQTTDTLPARAIEMSQKAVEAEPHNVNFLDTYAYVLLCSGNAEAAHKAIDSALQLFDEGQEDPIVLDHAGDIYNALGMKSMAIGFWTQAADRALNTAMRDAINEKIKTNRP